MTPAFAMPPPPFSSKSARNQCKCRTQPGRHPTSPAGLITDATTNPLFVSQAAARGSEPEYAALVDAAVVAARQVGNQLQLCYRLHFLFRVWPSGCFRKPCESHIVNQHVIRFIHCAFIY